MSDWVRTKAGVEVSRFKTEQEKLDFAKKLFAELKRLKSGGRPSIHADIKAQVHELRGQGLSYDKIARQLNISKGSVWNIINKK